MEIPINSSPKRKNDTSEADAQSQEEKRQHLETQTFKIAFPFLDIGKDINLRDALYRLLCSTPELKDATSLPKNWTLDCSSLHIHGINSQNFDSVAEFLSYNLINCEKLSLSGSILDDHQKSKVQEQTVHEPTVQEPPKVIECVEPVENYSIYYKHCAGAGDKPVSSGEFEYIPVEYQCKGKPDTFKVQDENAELVRTICPLSHASLGNWKNFAKSVTSLEFYIIGHHFCTVPKLKNLESLDLYCSQPCDKYGRVLPCICYHRQFPNLKTLNFTSKVSSIFESDYDAQNYLTNVFDFRLFEKLEAVSSKISLKRIVTRDEKTNEIQDLCQDENNFIPMNSKLRSLVVSGYSPFIDAGNEDLIDDDDDSIEIRSLSMPITGAISSEIEYDVKFLTLFINVEEITEEEFTHLCKNNLRSLKNVSKLLKHSSPEFQCTLVILTNQTPESKHKGDKYQEILKTVWTKFPKPDSPQLGAILFAFSDSWMFGF